MIHQLSKKRTIRYRADRVARQRTETRDAILWDILEDQRVCRVKIQGSDTLIVAKYPEHWRKVPEWLKIGNAVKVLHNGGNRTSLEIVGSGIAIPTPVPGGSAAPALPVGENSVLSGCQVYANGTDMTGYITPGTYRINDVIYTLEAGALVMAADSEITMDADSQYIMGQAAYYFTVSAASSTEYRIDAFFVGVDGVVDYITGTPSATNPQMPTTPAAHVLLGWVLIPPGTTVITQSLVNQVFVAPFATQMTATPDSGQLVWTDPSAVITIEVLDQYGRGITGTNWVINAQILSGSGTITSVASTGASGYTANFTYSRPNPQENELCPVFIEFVLSQYPDVTIQTALLLEDEFGDLIIG